LAGELGRLERRSCNGDWPLLAAHDSREVRRTRPARRPTFSSSDSKSDLEEIPMTQRLDYTAIAPAGIKALGSVYGYIVQSGLPRPLVNLVYLRASQINGCAR
jgi:alkylhydroperoxidase family enzyme